MTETFVHKEGKPFVTLPEIYQVELTNACDLECPMCLRSTDMLRHPGLLDLDLLRKMYYRGDFRGSYYVELQMAGEPTMHPNLEPVISRDFQFLG